MIYFSNFCRFQWLISGGAKDKSLNTFAVTASMKSVFLGAFAKFPKATIILVMSVRLPIRMEQLGSHNTHFL